MSQTKAKKMIPELRFPEFAGEWVEKKYGKIYSFHTTNSFSRDKLNYTKGDIKNIHYGDIHKKFSTMFDIEREDVPFINSEINLSKISEDSYCKEGDLVIADASEDYNDVGKTIEIINLSGDRVLAGLHTFLARPNNGIMAIGFAGYLLQSWNVRKQIMIIAQGTKVLGISTKKLSKINLVLPDSPEQQKIASFLSAIDGRLQALEKKKSLLEEYKKGVMQQIFTQQIRFRDADGKAFPEWEEKNGNSLFRSISDKNHNSDLPILAITQDQGAIPRDQINYNIGVTAKSVSSYKVVQIGDFIISLRSFQGGIEYSNYKGICSPAYIILRPKVELDSRFYKFYLKTPTYITELKRKLEGIRDGKMISYKYFSEIKLPLPSKKEQTRIANFLTALDQKIAGVGDQIAQTRAYKQGLLQKMFV